MSWFLGALLVRRADVFPISNLVHISALSLRNYGGASGRNGTDRLEWLVESGAWSELDRARFIG